MFKKNILSQIGADRYQKLIFEVLLLSFLGELCTALVSSETAAIKVSKIRNGFVKTLFLPKSNTNILCL